MILSKMKVKKAKTYPLFQTQHSLLSAKIREDQPDADLLPVQNPEDALVSNEQKDPARC